MVLTYKNKFNKKYGFDKDASHSLEEISRLSRFNLDGLTKIMSKGLGAYLSNPQSVRPNVKSSTQWAFARVYSSVMGGKASVIDAQHLFRD